MTIRHYAFFSLWKFEIVKCATIHIKISQPENGEYFIVILSNETNYVKTNWFVYEWEI